MARYSDKALQWVGRNRQPVNRTASIGQVAQRLLEGRSLSASKRLGALREVIAAAADAEFRRHCRLGQLRGGTLTVLVDDPSLTRPMKERWLVPLKELLGKRGPGYRVSSISFVAGVDGLPLGGPADATDAEARTNGERTD